MLTKTWKTRPECVVEFPSSVENIEKRASNTSCKNFTSSSPSKRKTLVRASWTRSGWLCSFHCSNDSKSTEMGQKHT